MLPLLVVVLLRRRHRSRPRPAPGGVSGRLGLTIAMVVHLIALLVGPVVLPRLDHPDPSRAGGLVVLRPAGDLPRVGTRAVLLAGILLMIGAAVLGPTQLAARIRAVVAAGIGRAGGTVAKAEPAGPVTASSRSTGCSSTSPCWWWPVWCCSPSTGSHRPACWCWSWSRSWSWPSCTSWPPPAGGRRGPGSGAGQRRRRHELSSVGDRRLDGSATSPLTTQLPVRGPPRPRWGARVRVTRPRRSVGRRGRRTVDTVEQPAASDTVEDASASDTTEHPG